MCFSLCLFACAVVQMSDFTFFRQPFMSKVVGLALYFGLLFLSFSITILPSKAISSGYGNVFTGYVLMIGVVVTTSFASVLAMYRKKDGIGKSVGAVLFVLLCVTVLLLLVVYLFDIRYPVVFFAKSNVSEFR